MRHWKNGSECSGIGVYTALLATFRLVWHPPELFLQTARLFRLRSETMKKAFLMVFLSGVVQSALGDTGTASKTAIESAWLAFNNARGEASLILGDVSHPTANAVFRTIPDISAADLDEAKLQLGTELFNDGRLSRDGSVACATCHIGMLGGVDRHPVSFGIGGARGTLNAPTIFNAALNFRQFWDGRALTLQEQVLGPIENEVEFGHDVEGVVAVLKSIPDYAAAFDRLYPDGVTAANLVDAIAYYETMNFTGIESPFLRQLKGEENQLSNRARRGQQRFVEVGCASCHNGINLGGNSYQQLGVADSWYGIDREASESDDGLYGRTGREQDRHVFKVPTLHNVAATAPWLHDGSVTSLQQAVDRMARYQSGRYLENQDIDDIVAFLRSLGDSNSLLGDCSASGRYGVSMDCDMKSVATGVTREGGPEQAVLPAPVKLANLHQQQYSEALQRAAAAPAKISEQMQRIRSGQVAHYDFLQYEHIEMLRHARALSFPPATFDPAQRKEALVQAAKWQKSAEQYELVIADFLRSQAVYSSAKANYLDLLRLLAIDADEKVLAMLANAEQSLLRFDVRPGVDEQLALKRTTQALQGNRLHPQWIEELQLQERLLLNNVPIIQ